MATRKVGATGDTAGVQAGVRRLELSEGVQDVCAATIVPVLNRGRSVHAAVRSVGRACAILFMRWPGC